MPVLLLLVCWSVLVASLRADDQHLIRPGEIWRYFKGISEPAGTAGEWRLAEYDDSAWPQSISGFGTAGIVNIEPGYLSDYGVGYRTVYFRRQFSVSDPASL